MDFEKNVCSSIFVQSAEKAHLSLAKSAVFRPFFTKKERFRDFSMNIYSFLGISIQNFDNFQFSSPSFASFHCRPHRLGADPMHDFFAFRLTRPYILG